MARPCFRGLHPTAVNTAPNFLRSEIGRSFGRSVVPVAVVVLVLLLGSQLSLGAGLSPARLPSKVGAVRSAGTGLESPIDQAAASLERGAGPARGVAMTCTTAGAYRCTPAVAGPVPLGAPKASWVNLTNASNAPSDREMMQMTDDPADGYVLLFGGGQFRNGNDNSETWTFAGGVWTQLSLSTSPGARMNGAMTYDAADGYVVMFGGADVVGGSFLSDTWTYSGGTWTQLSPTSNPTARWGMGMAYDATDKYVLLFGGEAGFGSYQGDTWKFSAGSWTQLSPTTHPPSRGDINMAYDTSQKDVVLFSGEAGGPNFNDTWNYSHGNWTNLTGSLSIEPPATGNAAFSYDPDYGGIVFVDFATASPYPTWLFAKHVWSQLKPTKIPPGVSRARSAYDAADGILILFGGQPTMSTSSGFPTWNFTWALAPNPVLVHLAVAPTVVDTGSLVKITAGELPANGAATYSYAGLPAGCTSSNVSTFTCRPTHTGSFVLNASITEPGGAPVVTNNVTLQVFAAPLVGSLTASPAPVTQGRPLNLSTSGVAGTSPFNYVYSGVPPGCPSVNRSYLTCDPASSGVYNVTVTVSDPRHGSATTWVVFRVNAQVALAQFSILPSPTVDVNETIHLSATPSGGTGSLTYRYTGLPPGCLGADTPTLSCAPTQTGLYTIHLDANDSQGSWSNVTLQVAVSADPVVASTLASPVQIDIGSAMTFTANVTGGTTPLSANWSGLPAGCTSGGALTFTCVPKTAGTYAVGLRVTDGAGVTVATSETVHVNPLPRITAVTYPGGGWDVGREFAILIAATGGTGGLTYSFQTSGSARTCTAGAVANVTFCDGTQVGAIAFKATVGDALGHNLTVAGVVAIHDLPSILAFSPTPAQAVVGEPVNLSFTASGGTGTLTYRVSGFTADCVLLAPPGFACQPTTPGTFNVTLTVTDAIGAEANASTLVVISPASSPSTVNSGLPVSTVDLALIGVVVAAAAVVGAWAYLRRRTPPAPPSEPEVLPPPP